MTLVGIGSFCMEVHRYAKKCQRTLNLSFRASSISGSRPNRPQVLKSKEDILNTVDLYKLLLLFLL